MALYAIGDLHLSIGMDKEMDIFGGKWEGYLEKITHSFKALTDEDAVVLCGDFCWAISLSGAEDCFRYIAGLPGKKYMIKGNHDYWWDTATKIRKKWADMGITNLELLHNNAHAFGPYALCGTRGCLLELEEGGHAEKIFRRELIRLEASLKAGKALGKEEILCFLHYPPLYGSSRCLEIMDLLEQYGVSRCYYGHLHGYGQAAAVQGEVEGVCYRMVSGDYLDFVPLLIGSGDLSANSLKKSEKKPI